MTETLSKLEKCIQLIATGSCNGPTHRAQVAKDAVDYCKALQALLNVYTR